MCQPASFVLTRDRAYWSRGTDSHAEIAEEHGIREDDARGVNAVKIRISPPAGYVALPLDVWVYSLDQDQTPEWYDAAECEARGRRALEAWAEARLIRGYRESVGQGERVWLLDGGTIGRMDGGAIGWIEAGGTIRRMNGGEIECISGGTIGWMIGGEIEWMPEGTIERMDGGTISQMVDGEIKSWRGGAIELVYAGTIVQQGSVSELPQSLGPHAIVIDRRGGEVVVHTRKTVRESGYEQNNY